jgi:NADH dehydrogenase FAD-containing subunit
VIRVLRERQVIRRYTRIQRLSTTVHQAFGRKSQLSTTMTSTKRRIIITGGGIGGLTLANFLHRLGHSVKVLEKRSNLVSDGASFTMSPNGQRVLNQLGYIVEAREFLQPLSSLVVRQGNGKVSERETAGRFNIYFTHSIYLQTRKTPSGNNAFIFGPSEGLSGILHWRL